MVRFRKADEPFSEASSFAGSMGADRNQQYRMWLFNCPFDNLSLQEAVKKVEEFVHAGKPREGVGVNVDQLIKMQKDQAFRKIILSSDLITADGQPIVWASRLLGMPLKERVTAIDLMEGLLKVASKRSYKVYCLGAREQVVKTAVQNYQKVFPGLRIVGYRSGYWTPEEEHSVAEKIHKAKPDLLFLAISSPKKEMFLRKHREILNVPFALGVGGAFDIAAGATQRAPRWMRRWGLEWFWRFLQEPKRMWRRYFVEDFMFFKLVLVEVWKKKKDVYY